MSRQRIVDDLIARVPEHAQAATLRRAITEALDVSERFKVTRSQIQRQGHLTPHGQKQALKDALAKQYARDLRDAQAPIKDAQARLESLRSNVKRKPAVDSSNLVSALERQELRATIAELPAAKRVQFVLGAKDPRIVEAVLGAPPVVSGIPEDVFAKIEAGYVERTAAAEVEEIRTLEAAVTAAQAAAQMARDAMQSTIGLDRKQFDEIVTPIEQKAGAPWLLRDQSSGEVLVVVPGETTYPRATEDQIRDGVFYKDFAEYRRAMPTGMPDTSTADLTSP